MFFYLFRFTGSCRRQLVCRPELATLVSSSFCLKCYAGFAHINATYFFFVSAFLVENYSYVVVCDKKNREKTT